MRDTPNPKDIGLIGHPYAPIGMGEHIRCSYRALRSVGVNPTVTDIYQLVTPTREDVMEFGKACTNRPAAINIFHINADEVEQAMTHLASAREWTGYNIIYPAWELSRYPAISATQLDRFDEIWAPSRFIRQSVEGACTKPVFYMPLACEVVLSSFLSRRYFGISESDYVFLFFFDVRSFQQRKNPQGVIAAFRKLLAARPYGKARLVLKVNGAELDPERMERLRHDLADIGGSVDLLTQVMTDNEVKNLVRNCDCFLSLHRSEGFGRGISEAMFLGKPVIATAYSGNMDYMAADASLPVDYAMIPVGRDEYPHWQNQEWADPDIDQAVNYMVGLIDNPAAGRELGRRASAHIRKQLGYRKTGLRYRERLEAIARGEAVPQSDAHLREDLAS